MAVYSHSRITCFENCPYKYKLKYIDKVRPEIEQTIEAFMGSLVHSALEKLYNDLRFQKLNRLDDILAFYNDQWGKNWNPAILLVRKQYSPDNYRSMGEAYIRNYYKRHHPFDRAKTVGLEQRIMIDLGNNGRYMLQGYMDRLAFVEKATYEIHDYKTNSSLPLRNYLEEDRQLALYALAVKRTYPNADRIRLVWHFLSFNQDVVLEKTDEQLEKLRLETIESIRKIESARYFPTRAARLCDWCEFRQVCPEWGHVAKTESMPLKKFLSEPGVKLVNRYAELSEKKKELDDELDQVREALFRFGEEHGVSLVSGSGYSAKLWSAEKLRFPRKDEPGRHQLEDFLRKAHLWKDVSSLDTFLLSKAMEDPPWPHEIANAVAKFGRLETIRKIYLKKKEPAAD
ncbi:MAG: PD-(D/E)XK nuclease family protein [Candidatus Aenigmarchaeota archaeon]|nr:PD-(D/E)XK nuclease family protein [Candidatus Aenigmarchaeota archaeon]